MSELPFISVVVPHLNQPGSLRDCLRSLTTQAYPADRFEIIVVDNGSISLPSAVISAFAGVRLAYEDRPGPGPARNRGASLARGEILAFVDADCTADSSWLATIAREFRANPPRTILGGDVKIGYRDPAHLTMLEAYESVFAYRQKEYIEQHGFSGTGNLAVTRHDFAEIGTFPGIEMAEDRVWGRQAIARNYRVLYVPDMIIFHPARRTFGELYAKWDRHILHDYAEWFRDGKGRLQWMIRSFAIAGSPIVDLRRIIRSPRIAGWMTRTKAALALTRIRLYRAGQMALLALSPHVTGRRPSWNRTTPAH